jgi:asparagine synthase (glutamine-hydrolysing)
MTGLCGWLGAIGGKTSPDKILAKMSSALDLMQPSAKTEGVARPDSGMGGIAGGVNIWAGEHILCAVDGRPGFDDPALAEIAAKSGNAKAFAEGYELYSNLVLERLHGPFSVSIVDPRKDEVFIAVDRLGIHALAYAAGPGFFVFGSTTDAVRRHPAVTSTISSQAVYNYLFNYIVPSPASIYNEQNKLLPGQFIRCRRGKIEKQFYWEMPYTHAHHGSVAEWSERLWSVLNKSFAHSIEGLDPEYVGAFLSGGLDSSTVAGLLARSVKKARTFTIGFTEPEFDESGFARIASDHFHTDHHEYFVTPRDVVELMPRIAEVYDEPYGNTSAVPTFYCARMAAAAGVKVMLAGDGGDEIFAGNERYAHMLRIEQYGRLPAWMRTRVLEPALGMPGVKKLRLAAKGLKLAERYATPMPERIYSHNYLADGTPENVLSDELLAEVDLGEPMAQIREAYWRPKEATMLQRMMHLDLKITLADNDLRKVNRMCRLAGVEVRYPLLSDELVSFAASVPPEILLPGTKLRHFFKQAMRGFLPLPVLEKKKHGFGLPFNVWIKSDSELQALILDQLSMLRRRNYLKPAFLDEVTEGCRTAEPRSTDGMAWDMAILEMWLQKHHDRVR